MFVMDGVSQQMRLASAPLSLSDQECEMEQALSVRSDEQRLGRRSQYVALALRAGVPPRSRLNAVESLGQDVCCPAVCNMHVDNHGGTDASSVNFLKVYVGSCDAHVPL